MNVLELPCTLLNASYEHHKDINVLKAIRMLNRGKVVITEAYEGRMIGPFVVPKKCAYCGKPAKTVDHVRPKAQGGKTKWDNTVSACFPCNNKKDNRTPEQANMKLLWEPYEPTWWEMSRLVD
jgi:5-methylcytosine-specific restriction endonuclease McrA